MQHVQEAINTFVSSSIGGRKHHCPIPFNIFPVFLCPPATSSLCGLNSFQPLLQQPWSSTIRQRSPPVILCGCFGIKPQLQQVEDTHISVWKLVMAPLWPGTDLCNWKFYITPPLNTTHGPSETSSLGAPIKNIKQWAILLKLKKLPQAWEQFKWKLKEVLLAATWFSSYPAQQL